MRWSHVSARQPDLVRRMQERLVGPGLLLVVTLRLDGTPRLSPVEPVLLHGRLLLSMMWGSLKARDLERDPRILVHSIVSDRDGADGEVKVRGRVQAVDDADLQHEYAAYVAEHLGWPPEVGRFHLFEVDIEQVASVRYGDQGDQLVATWPEGREFVRRETGATSVGEPEEVVDLLVPEHS